MDHDRLAPTPEKIARVDTLLRLGKEQNRDQLTGWEANRNIVHIEYSFGVYRFLDADGTVTSAAREYKSTDEGYSDLLTKFEGSSSWDWLPLWKKRRRRRIGREADRTLRRMTALEKKAYERAAERLIMVAQTSRKIAVENRDHTFRMITESEISLLLVTPLAAQVKMLLVFEPSDTLFALKLEEIAHVM